MFGRNGVYRPLKVNKVIEIESRAFHSLNRVSNMYIIFEDCIIFNHHVLKNINMYPRI